MVRFIMYVKCDYTYWTFIIYIPLWLDLLYRLMCVQDRVDIDLHSTMVRFIMTKLNHKSYTLNTFTFHYG